MLSKSSQAAVSHTWQRSGASHWLRLLPPPLGSADTQGGFKSGLSLRDQKLKDCTFRAPLAKPRRVHMSSHPARTSSMSLFPPGPVHQKLPLVQWGTDLLAPSACSPATPAQDSHQRREHLLQLRTSAATSSRCSSEVQPLATSMVRLPARLTLPDTRQHRAYR